MDEQYEPHEIKLAREIADALQDWDSLPMHLQYVRRYKEEYLRKKLQIVLSIDERKIRTNRAAYYNFLVREGDKHGNARY